MQSISRAPNRGFFVIAPASHAPREIRIDVLRFGPAGWTVDLAVVDPEVALVPAELIDARRRDDARQLRLFN